MRHRGTQPAEIPPGFILGSKIDVASWQGPEMFVDLSGNTHCIVGYRTKDQPSDLPYYHPSVAARDRDGRSSYRFVELRRGTLARSGFLRDDQHYRPIADRWLILPSGADSYFGVVKKCNREEDEAATRELFGGTAADISAVASAFARLIGRGYHEGVRLPRVTFSKTRQNQCDITGCLIPKDFPYVAFDESQYAWSHVSLHGFYRLLSFLCSRKSANPMRETILDAGVAADLLDSLRANAEVVGEPLPYPDSL